MQHQSQRRTSLLPRQEFHVRTQARDLHYIAVIVMSRVGGAVSASRTFDITITMKGGAGEHQFSNINRSDYYFLLQKCTANIKTSEEQQPLEDFFQAKNLKTKNEMIDDVCSPCNTYVNDH